MKWRWLMAILLTACGGIAGYAAWIGPEDSRWMFGTFALLFFMLASLPFWPKPARAEQPAAPAETRFAPHWVMMLAIVLLGLVLLIGAWRLLS